MAYHIIGLDRGSCTVKAVILERSFRGYEVKGTRQVAVPQDGTKPPSRESIQAAVAQLVGEFDPGAVGYVTDYPGRQASSWFFQLPFTDQKRIDQTLPFELENYVPFDLEDMVLDYRVVRNVAGKSRVLAALAPRVDVRETLQQLRSVRVDPRSLLLDGYTLAYIPPGKEPGDKALAIIDIGHTQTLVTVRWGQVPDFMRTIPLGGLHVTQALMSAFGVNYRTAELMKARLEPVEPVNDEKTEVVGQARPDDVTLPRVAEERLQMERLQALGEPEAVPDASDDESDEGDSAAEITWFSGRDLEDTGTGHPAVPGPGAQGGLEPEVEGHTVESEAPEVTIPHVSHQLFQTAEGIERVVWEAMAPILQEIRNALVAYEGLEHQEIGAVLLVGGGALLRGLPERLSEDLGVPAGLPVKLGPDQVTLDEGGALPRFALPFALAYLGATEGRFGEINFRRGEFSYRKNYEALRVYLLGGIGLALIGLMVLTGMFFSKARELNQKSAQLDAQITSAIKTAFPDIAVDASKGIDQPLALMMEQHAKLMEHGKVLGVGSARRKSVDVLREISSYVPPREEIVLDVDDYSYEGEQVKLRGTTDSFEGVDKIERALQGSGLVKEVKSDVGSKGDKKNFTLSVTLKAADEVTGP